MANISKIQIPDGTVYTLKDPNAISKDLDDPNKMVYTDSNGYMDTRTVVDGYTVVRSLPTTNIDENTVYLVPVNPTIELQDKEVEPSESVQTVTADAGYDGLGTVTVDAIPSDYVGSGISERSSSDLTASGATVTAPAGYYASSASKTVASGTAGTPTATKGTVSNHSVSVTPSVTNTTGYITGSTKTGTAVTVSASELVSGSETKTANGTYDVTNLASLVVNVAGSSKAMQFATSGGRTNTTALSSSGLSLTVTKAGTYTIRWNAVRTSTSGTSSSRAYKGSTALGTENTSWTNSYYQINTLTGQTLAVDDTITVYTRARSTSYYTYAVGLCIIEE